MLTFGPPDLEERLRSALRSMPELDASEWINLLDAHFDRADYDFDAPVTVNTIAGPIGLPECDESFYCTVAELVEWGPELAQARMVDRRRYLAPGRTLVHLEAFSPETLGIVEGIANKDVPRISQSVDVAQGRCTLSVVCGLTPFAIMIAREGGYDELNPPCQETDLFIELRCPPTLDTRTADLLVNAFQYQLSVELSLDFESATFRERFEYDDQFKDMTSRLRKQLDARLERLRPLRWGRGLSEVQRLYVVAACSTDREYQILCFVKAIEYVAVTSMRLTAHDAVRQRLSSPKALDPDASFIEDLMTLSYDFRKREKSDAKLIADAIALRCDAVLLSPHAPKCVTGLASIDQTSAMSVCEKALRDLAECVSSTRNQIAHGKANYESTGKECPTDQYEDLATTLRVTVQQLISWFAMVPDAQRLAP